MPVFQLRFPGLGLVTFEFYPHAPKGCFLFSINLSRSSRSTHLFRRSLLPFPGSAPKRTTGNVPSAINSSRRSPLQERYLHAPSRDRRRTGYAIRSSLCKLSVSFFISNGVTQFPVTISAVFSAPRNFSHQKNGQSRCRKHSPAGPGIHQGTLQARCGIVRPCLRGYLDDPVKNLCA